MSIDKGTKRLMGIYDIGLPFNKSFFDINHANTTAKCSSLMAVGMNRNSATDMGSACGMHGGEECT
jgi:hypothetical protein